METITIYGYNYTMSTIYVCGHKNPDMDSITSAISYAYLKNKTDRENTYVPVRCGHMNASTKSFFEKEGLTPPVHMKDAFIHIDRVYTPVKTYIDVNDPIYKITSLFQSSKLRTSIIPVFEDGKYKSLLSVDAISRWFLKENFGTHRPIYNFRFDTWESVLGGEFLKRNKDRENPSSLMVAAMDVKRFEEKISRVSKKGINLIVIMSARKEYLDIAKRHDVEAIVIVGSKKNEVEKLDLDSFNGSVFVSHLDTAETIRLLRLTGSISSLLTEDYPVVHDHELFEDVKRRIAESELRGFPVFDENEAFLGYVSRRNFLEKPSLKFVLVDHNESDQAIPGIEDAQIVEIVDHHRIAMQKTKQPIYVFAEPLGSTNTIVYQLYKRWHIQIPEKIAKVMLAGILSDTVALKSPTTTIQDKKAVEHLLSILSIDMDTITSSIFSHTETLNNLDPRKTILSDFKQYEEKGVSFGIGQCEVSSVRDITEETIEKYLLSLDDIAGGRGLKWTMLLITDLLSSSSILLSSKFNKADELPWEKIGKQMYDLPEVLSRKKQLLPAVLKVLEE